MKLTSEQMKTIEHFLKSRCRQLEQARFAFLFGNGSPGRVLDELKKFQNPDGGFGNGLEPDFLLRDSSPMATSVAFQIMGEIPEPDEEVIRKSIGYLEHEFVPGRSGWFAVSEEVNQYPHAVWWHWDGVTKHTVIDRNWGNPSAELIGYLLKYRKRVTALDIDALVDHALAYWEKMVEFPSEHETYCFIRLHRLIPPVQAGRLEKSLMKAAQSLVAFDPEKWKEYTPQPVHFAPTPGAFLYDVVKDGIEANLDYLVTSLNEEGVWAPNWTWFQYEDAWPESKVKWEGILAIQNLKVLSAYGRIQK